MNYKKLSIIFFTSYLLTGLLVFKDYGINYDDGSSRYNGLTNWNYIFNNDRELFSSWERYHGPALEIILVGVEKLFGLSDTRHIWLAHHLSTFLFFYLSVIAFFFCSRKILGSDKWGLVACLMLVLSPRIFGDSFHNSKDIGFLSASIFAFYTLLRLIDKPNATGLLLHSAACGFAIDIRILGIIMVGVTVVMLFKELIAHPDSRKKYLFLLILYPVLLFGFVVAFWPVLWHAPGYEFEQALLQMKHFPWDNSVLYQGSHINASRLPWHYLPVWILITTPSLFTLFWLAGTGILIVNFATNPLSFFKNKFIWAIILFLSAGPIIAIISLKSVVYDAWRHVFFIYPYFVLIALYGFKDLSERAIGVFKKTFFACIVLYFLLLTGINAYMHPYENIYFNFPALAYFNPIEKQFESDYWGLSYKQGLEYLINSNAEEKSIKVYAHNGPGIWNREILKKTERPKLDFKDNISEADFFITNHRFEFTAPPSRDKIAYEIKRFGIPILTVYKLREQ